MITRYVRLTLQHDRVDDFKAIFHKIQPRIEATDGCLSVQLLQDIDHNNIVATLSKWRSVGYLENYRSSDLFRSTWAEVKPMFLEKAVAHSYVET